MAVSPLNVHEGALEAARAAHARLTKGTPAAVAREDRLALITATPSRGEGAGQPARLLVRVAYAAN